MSTLRSTGKRLSGDPADLTPSLTRPGGGDGDVESESDMVIRSVVVVKSDDCTDSGSSSGDAVGRAEMALSLSVRVLGDGKSWLSFERGLNSERENTIGSFREWG